ncbi:hypothetical protein BDZ45DRAFT_362677 [Acephala macrosclerotiorum]|nr:hypothetical protein BDZ45DRAFT_362677 [Acephala macrosclerotiorum]
MPAEIELHQVKGKKISKISSFVEQHGIRSLTNFGIHPNYSSTFRFPKSAFSHSPHSNLSRLLFGDYSIALFTRFLCNLNITKRTKMSSNIHFKQSSAHSLHFLSTSPGVYEAVRKLVACTAVTNVHLDLFLPIYSFLCAYQCWGQSTYHDPLTLN